VSINNQPVDGTNIIDLINDVLRYRKNAPEPNGWESLAEVMKSINIPFEVIGNWKRRAFIAGTSHQSNNNKKNGGDSNSRVFTSRVRRTYNKNIPFILSSSSQSRSLPHSSSEVQTTPTTTLNKKVKWDKLSF